MRASTLAVEGGELAALRSIDWSQTSVDFITIENADSGVVEVLHRRDMVPTLCLSMDTLFVRSALAWAPAQWYADHAQRTAPGCVSNETRTQCLSKPNWAFLNCQKEHAAGRYV